MLTRLDLVLERLAWAGMTAKASKCVLFATSAAYLGHIISRKGLEMEPAKIQKILDIDPKSINTLERVRSFVGLCSYYRRFVKGFASITAPLADLTKAGVDVATESQKPEVQQAVIHSSQAARRRYDVRTCVRACIRGDWRFLAHSHVSPSQICYSRPFSRGAEHMAMHTRMWLCM